MNISSLRASPQLRRNLEFILRGPPGLAFLPALCLGAFWFGGEGALIAVAAVVPSVYLIVGGSNWPALHEHGPISGIVDRTVFEARTADTFKLATEENIQTAIFIVAIDGYDELVERYGQASAERVELRTGERLVGALRSTDLVGNTGDARF